VTGGIVVRLSEQELHEATQLGRDTDAICALQKLKPRQKAGKLAKEIDGARAEFAVAKLYGLDKPRLNIVGDDHKDLWIGDLSIDVKHTATADLIFDSMGHFKADLAVLVHDAGSPHSLLVVGCISRAQFEAKARSEQRLHGMRLCLKAEELSPPESLWRAAQTRRFDSLSHNHGGA
jgi:hypothetical protein